MQAEVVRSVFARLPAVSIDYGVMEKTERAVVVPADIGWSDVGSWDALHALSSKDEAGNALAGPAHSIEANSNFVFSEGPSVTLVGVENLIVVATADEVLILPRGSSQDVRKAAAHAKSRKA